MVLAHRTPEQREKFEKFIEADFNFSPTQKFGVIPCVFLGVIGEPTAAGLWVRTTRGDLVSNRVFVCSALMLA